MPRTLQERAKLKETKKVALSFKHYNIPNQTVQYQNDLLAEDMHNIDLLVHWDINLDAQQQIRRRNSSLIQPRED